MSSTLQPPQQQQQRPRSKSTFSFRSDKSGDVNALNSKPIVNMKDAKRTEKKSRFGKQKSDPNKALTEQQPGSSSRGESCRKQGVSANISVILAMFAQSEQSTLGALKGHQYRDSLGNPIGMLLSFQSSTDHANTSSKLTQIPQTRHVLVWSDPWIPSDLSRPPLIPASRGEHR
jgi:hypothetical protein